ncbi:D-glycerate dehydrogenase [Acidaminobacter sp. JC074]|uniref:2-hydroxyacid dehydrogenase n=1 Tax=Acidaminobacter sp. JC074 TaxID=2530199 RepID=UPI001F114EA4|nr:D-glycerate dehydrogenase [Acidaminobacter sp. JC074]MCH4890191.1 D-glycerate dehydrogenase [Acidaminobacter sp. JC074]
MKKVLVTDLIPESSINLLQEHFDVTVNKKGRNLTKDEMMVEFKKYDGILTMFTDTVDQDIIETLDHTEIIANYAVGYNNIDTECARSKGIIVTNTPGVLSDTTAETAWALLFAVSRRVVEADHLLRNGGWGRFSYDFLSGQDIYKKTIGIIGAGRIGQKMAEKTVGFHMPILYHNRNRNFEFEEKFNAKYVDLETLLKESDIVSLHMPLTNETHHLLDYEKLCLMKEHATLINTARGPVIDEKALIKVLEEKRIFGAGLDVFEHEPMVPEALIKMKNVVLLPHIGSSSIETRSAMGDLAANNIIAVLSGKAPLTQV